MIYIVLSLYFILLRLVEVMVAKSNEKFQKQRGAIEVNDPYYKAIVMTHSLFFIVLLTESYIVHEWQRDISIVVFTLLVMVQVLRFWTLASLGRFWNTKVIVLPSANLVVKGPYKWMKHPNYVIVGLEFILIPILFYSYVTATVFLSLHLWLMTKRIPLENQALQKLSPNKGRDIR
ncbi:isoprenylcysteine carboxyl methyltransferase family protein [Aquisalibacillus elongatus]|uniref:15-methylpalmitoyl-4-hydroxy-2-pyrone 4-O-methyltransferase n=1 Tax=Aquisalibacillus elongatus TaxID=485577 RepID=A0A3N5CEX2_9BACI|nr:isoprenylcysteine carboxylmethyltransferase family protein [Aquisalibacillus elongatus]RPF55811.1 15-methylpalmitoyl-4-hydroxy-2-pyrone 4-O-methyltransferase [Aquisalibacillus elongatus]